MAAAIQTYPIHNGISATDQSSHDSNSELTASDSKNLPISTTSSLSGSHLTLELLQQKFNDLLTTVSIFHGEYQNRMSELENKMADLNNKFASLQKGSLKSEQKNLKSINLDATTSLTDHEDAALISSMEIHYLSSHAVESQKDQDSSISINPSTFDSKTPSKSFQILSHPKTSGQQNISSNSFKQDQTSSGYDQHRFYHRHKRNEHRYAQRCSTNAPVYQPSYISRQRCHHHNSQHGHHSIVHSFHSDSTDSPEQLHKNKSASSDSLSFIPNNMKHNVFEESLDYIAHRSRPREASQLLAPSDTNQDKLNQGTLGFKTQNTVSYHRQGNFPSSNNRFTRKRRRFFGKDQNYNNNPIRTNRDVNFGRNSDSIQSFRSAGSSSNPNLNFHSNRNHFQDASDDEEAYGSYIYRHPGYHENNLSLLKSNSLNEHSFAMGVPPTTPLQLQQNQSEYTQQFTSNQPELNSQALQTNHPTQLKFFGPTQGQLGFQTSPSRQQNGNIGGIGQDRPLIQSQRSHQGFNNLQDQYVPRKTTPPPSFHIPSSTPKPIQPKEKKAYQDGDSSDEENERIRAGNNIRRYGGSPSCKNNHQNEANNQRTTSNNNDNDDINSKTSGNNNRVLLPTTPDLHPLQQTPQDACFSNHQSQVDPLDHHKDKQGNKIRPIRDISLDHSDGLPPRGGFVSSNRSRTYNSQLNHQNQINHQSQTNHHRGRYRFQGNLTIGPQRQ